MKRLIQLLVITFLVAACASQPETKPVGAPTPPPPADANAVRLTVYFATDRNLTGRAEAASKFGSQRADSLTYGACEVLLPRDKRAGEAERPTLWKLEHSDEIGEDPLLASTALLPDGDFLKKFSARVETAEKKSALVFIHGYNVEFADAAASAAKLAYKLSFDGPVIFYSWPSKGQTAEYFADEATIEWSAPNVRKFLEKVIDETGAENLYLVAHSMGNRALTRATVALAVEKPKLAKKIREVILAAPDIDKGVFKRDIAPALVRAGLPVTLYAAADDRALAISKKIHSFPRAGDAGEGLVVLPGVETVDCSEAGGGFFNHSYITEDAAVLSDIFYLLHYSMRAGKRAGLFEVHSTEGKYWKLAK